MLNKNNIFTKELWKFMQFTKGFLFTEQSYCTNKAVPGCSQLNLERLFLLLLQVFKPKN